MRTHHQLTLPPPLPPLDNVHASPADSGKVRGEGRVVTLGSTLPSHPAGAVGSAAQDSPDGQDEESDFVERERATRRGLPPPVPVGRASASTAGGAASGSSASSGPGRAIYRCAVPTASPEVAPTSTAWRARGPQNLDQATGRGKGRSTLNRVWSVGGDVGCGVRLQVEGGGVALPALTHAHAPGVSSPVALASAPPHSRPPLHPCERHQPDPAPIPPHHEPLLVP